jgi:medium-chain acyl-[acyl-carrier-protein] hydrolase
MMTTAGSHHSKSAIGWLTYKNSKASAEMRLFCFPYAGGGAAIFHAWAEALPPTIELCAAQLPGRETRWCEPAFTRLQELVDATVTSLLPLLDRPFALFGHSMGALIGFELARSLSGEHKLAPVHLFVAGRRAPQVPDPDPPTYNLPDAQFIEELQRLNGTPRTVLEHPELLSLMMPTLRADFELCQTYEYMTGPPLTCPLTVLSGLQDLEVTRDALEAWREQTNGRFKLRLLPGDHFFLHSAQAQILQVISQELYCF